jgi:hypothetical protein
MLNKHDYEISTKISINRTTKRELSLKREFLIEGIVVENMAKSLQDYGNFKKTKLLTITPGVETSGSIYQR